MACAVAVALISIVASAIGFLRGPVLAARGRLVRGVAWLVEMTLAATILSIGVYWFATRPSLSHLSSITLSPDGKRLVVATTG